MCRRGATKGAKRPRVEPEKAEDAKPMDGQLPEDDEAVVFQVRSLDFKWHGFSKKDRVWYHDVLPKDIGYLHGRHADKHT